MFHEKTKVLFEGKFVDFKDATISIANVGFLYGLGVFTGMRAHWNAEQQKLFLFRPRDHYERFRNACKLSHYHNFLENYDEQKFVKVIVELLRINQVKQDVYIRVTNYSDAVSITPKFHYYPDSLCAYLYALGDYVPTTGMKVMVSSWTRIEDNMIPARAKFNGAYLNTCFAKSEALMRGFEEALFLDQRGHVVEGSAENIFLVLGGALVTPPVSDNILEGITRRSVIELARDEGIEVIERSIDRTELYKAAEILLTGTGAQVSPVVLVDTYEVGNGEVGPISMRLQARYAAAVRGNDPRFASWVEEIPAWEYASDKD